MPSRQSQGNQPRPSPEREPWRFLRSSIAIQFVSDKKKEWSPNALPQDTQHDVLSALEARWEVRNAYANFKTQVSDLLRAATNVPNHGRLTASPNIAESDQLDRLRQVALSDGPLSATSEPILKVLEWLDLAHEDLEVLARGFIEVRQKKSGEITISIEIPEQRRRFTPSELRAQSWELLTVLTEARELLTDLIQAQKLSSS